ncbi:MAG TPA: 50S ribosomal protein L25 [Candidatus Saccharimonadales bacterium]|nr:50S ribosomal protein L25 [Candidatus Saccharimonadales bacterium]
MITDIKVMAKAREIEGRKASRKLARLGLVPGVLYGGRRAPVKFQMDPRGLDAILHGASSSTTLFNFEIEGLEKPVVTIIKDLQHDPLTGNVIHADLFRISMDQEIHVKVAIHLTGVSRGVKQQGGVLDFVCRAVEISCLPAEIPERIELDVSELDLGHSIKVGDIKFSDKVTVLTDPSTPVATVLAPAAEKAAAAEEEVAAAATAEAAEPEVIKKGKAEEGAEKKEGGAEKSEK